MGPCQGGFCIYRATGILHGVERLDGAEASASLRDFLQERWKGVWPILYGDQLRQARLDDWIFQGLLDVEHLPERHVARPTGAAGMSHHDVVVVGAGLAGPDRRGAAGRGGRARARAGQGRRRHAPQPGTIDVLGYAPDRGRAPARGARPAARRRSRTIRTRWSAPTASRRRSSGSRAASPTARSRPTPTPAAPRRTCCCRPRSACRSRPPWCRRRWRRATCATAATGVRRRVPRAEGLPPGVARRQPGARTRGSTARGDRARPPARGPRDVNSLGVRARVRRPGVPRRGRRHARRPADARASASRSRRCSASRPARGVDRHGAPARAAGLRGPDAAAVGARACACSRCCASALRRAGGTADPQRGRHGRRARRARA